MYAEAEQKGVARMDARLTILKGPSSGQTMPIPAGTLIIGREKDCELRSMSEFVSRHHCVVLHDEYSLRIRDLGSTNGTFVNDCRITNGETILLHGDIVSIGDLAFKIDLEPAMPESARVALAELAGHGVL